jgi:alpha-tubulin suppressor-like RCC1 family protein
LLALVLPLAVMSTACDSSSQSSSCPAGSERCACYANHTCNAGLSCLSDRCVSGSGTGDSGWSSLDAGDAGAGGAPGGGGAFGLDGAYGTGAVSGSGGVSGAGGEISAADAGASERGSGGSATGGNGGAGDGRPDMAGGSDGNSDSRVDAAGGSGAADAGAAGGSGAAPAGTGGAMGGSGGALDSGGGNSDGLLSNVLAVEGGEGFTCALMLDRTVRCWGNGDSGQIGDGAFTSRPYPTVVPNLSDVKALSAESVTICALKMDGTVACWGGNWAGQVGNGDTENQPSPVTVPGVTGAVGVAASTYHTCALLGDGTAKCWGGNDSGQFGDTDPTPRTTPVAIAGLNHAVSIAAGDYHTCAVLDDGSAKCWGNNGSGQLGAGSASDSPAGPTQTVLTGISSLSAGHDYTCALTTGGTVRCWGLAVALGVATPPSPGQPSTTGLAAIAAVTAGSQHACALYGIGTVLCWGGFNSNGELGTGDQNSHATPTPVKGISSALAIGSGSRHTCVVLADRTLRCWGSNEFGGLGDGTTTDAMVPVAVRLGPGGGVGDADGSPGPNMVPNGDFAAGKTSWQTTNVANAFGDVADGVFCFSYGDLGYGTLGTTGPLALVGGATYEFSFRAWTTITADATVSMTAKVGDASPPYLEYSSIKPVLSTTPTAFSKTLWTLADQTAGIAFITSASYHGDICIDDVVLRRTQ